MKELEYPFDAKLIGMKKIKLKKQLLAENKNYITKRIAILGGFTTNDIKMILELFLLNYGIKPEFYESEYNQFYQDAVFENAKLKEFSPEIIYVCTSNHNITLYPVLQDSSQQVDQLLKDEMDKFETIWKNLFERYHCPIIQNNFEMPYYRLLGNRDAWDIHGATNFLMRLNMDFCKYAQSHENFFICDLNYISADYGLKEWSDPFYWHMYKYAVALPAIPYLSYNIANIIKSLLGKNKKSFVLDLDNTLWGGVIGDDGVDNIVLGPEESEGQAYSKFQRYIKAHQQIGVILNIDSKNDYENAISGLKHPDSVFTEDDFIAIKANWSPKSTNFLEIATELNLLPESLVFIDDNPAERHIVTSQLPGVCAPELDRVFDYIGDIDRAGYFEVTNLSKDDLARNDMYKSNAVRAKQEASFANYSEYLDSLEMKAVIAPFEPVYMARIAQLTNKSNQFNLTTRRYTQTEIEKVAKNEDFISLYGKLQDKFGDNGVVSVVIGHIIENICHIDLWIMSCRVLKRDMEFAMMDELVSQCKARGVSKIMGYYYPTAKNHMVEDFYQIQGFSKADTDSSGDTTWMLNLSSSYVKKNNHILVNQES